MRGTKGRRIAMLCVLVAFCLTLYGLGTAMAEESLEYVGNDSCLGCHDSMEDDFELSLHGRAFGPTGNERGKGCESCHGPGEEHEDDPSDDNIITFGKDSMQSLRIQNGQCLRCHAANQDVAMWEMDQHAKQDVSCVSCHPIHKSSKPMADMPETCYSCHLNVKMDGMKQSRHPIREGKVTCVDCHNPHGTLSDGMMRADTQNELCYQCHADKRGPYLWEHEPVEEDCGACHEPHGSRHKKLLTQRTPGLCQSCHPGGHANNPTPDRDAGFSGPNASNKVFGRNCMQCHPNVHGSWAPSKRGSRLIY